jgi:leader peptidase (prepilin peptidase)/N-methyltransferase
VRKPKKSEAEASLFSFLVRKNDGGPGGWLTLDFPYWFNELPKGTAAQRINCLSDDLVVLILLALAAPFIGSFLGVLALRLPARRSVILGRSECDRCRHVLGPMDLIPFASFLMTGGRCRYCKAPVDRFHIVIEVGALAVVLWAATVTAGYVLLASVVFGWVLLTLGAIDWRTGLLPDVLTIPLLLLGLVATYLLAPSSLPDHLIGAIGGGVFFVAVAWAYRRLRGRDGLGFGDAKLLAAIGAWVSWTGLPTVVLFAALIGIAGAAVMAGRGGPPGGARRIAFGPPLALAAWLVWLYGPLVPA